MFPIPNHHMLVLKGTIQHTQNRCVVDKSATETKATQKNSHKNTAATNLWLKNKQIVVEKQKDS